MDDNPYTIEWEPDMKYKLLYKGEVFADGRMSPDIITEFVRLMNVAYRNGKTDNVGWFSKLIRR